MKKNILILFFVFICLYNNSSFAAEYDLKLSLYKCDLIIKHYGIDPKIKSAKGWNRIFDNDKWKKTFQLDQYSEEELECLKRYILENAMDVKEYNRFIGMELKK